MSDKLSIMDFEEDERSLGRLVLHDQQQSEVESMADVTSLRPETFCTKQNLELKTDLRTFVPQQKEFSCACDVAAFSNNEIVVADVESLSVDFFYK